MDQEDVDRIAERVVDRLTIKSRAEWVDPETHARHHRHVATLIQREEDMSELKKKILYSTCMWAVPLLIAFALSSFWQSIVKVLKGAVR